MDKNPFPDQFFFDLPVSFQPYFGFEIYKWG